MSPIIDNSTVDGAFIRRFLLTKYFIFCIIFWGLHPVAKGLLRAVGHFLEKGVMCMEYIFIFLTVFCVLEIVKYIKKPANTCQEFFEKSLKFIELNFFAQ